MLAATTAGAVVALAVVFGLLLVRLERRVDDLEQNVADLGVLLADHETEHERAATRPRWKAGS